MKLRFDANLPYQDTAVTSAVRLFSGQTTAHSSFTISAYNGQIGLGESPNGIGIGNKLNISDDEITQNLRQIQLENGLPQQTQQLNGNYDFDIEMETGTGKTYVYTKTILELNKTYGFAKFIIVVPNIAIKEGVAKSLEITKDHFNAQYRNLTYDNFIYDSQKLEQIRDFATADTVKIMIINIDAFRKSFDDPAKETKSNIIHRPNDKLNGMRPIDLIAETNPILIIDEPQSVDTTPKAKEAIRSLNPLCILRYSATHVEKHNLLYKLDAVDSYDLGLVKQIEVAGFTTKDNHNTPYLCLKSAQNKNGSITAKLEMDILEKGSIKRKTVSVKAGDDLYEKSKGRDVYDNLLINDISCEPGNEHITLSRDPGTLHKGEIYGEIDPLIIKEHQISRTIQEHLDKELRLNPKGIKVLSLFFLDKVANYYGDDNKKGTGPYAKIFEREYKKIISQEKYKHLRHAEVPVDTVHDGYFSRDKQKKAKDTKGESDADNDAYNLIMKEKEKLLSFDCPIRFIFSHSALREGWDNPNVFQICTLNETTSETKKRQEIGRGLRLCVDQTGERQHDRTINILTVMANESYEEFAAELQTEYERDGGIRFGILETHSFANIQTQTGTETTPLGADKSAELYQKFLETGYIDQKGNILDTLRQALKEDSLQVPEAFTPLKDSIAAICKKAAGSLNIRSADAKKLIKRNKQILLSEDFKTLWDKIKYKTTYAVEFDSTKLIQNCIDRMQNLIISRPKLIYTKAELNIAEGGVDATENVRQTDSLETASGPLPDLIMYLQNRTGLTRKTLTLLLTQSNTLDKFLRNPQKYMDEVGKIILSEMRQLLIDGIKYTRLGSEDYYTMELIFPDQVLTGYLKDNIVDSKKSPYDYVLCDSQNECGFAEKFEQNADIKLYAKLPDEFKIPTPLGSYNPDWAVLIEKNGIEKLYFVLETKASLETSQLRPSESGKITCGRKHFEALNTGITFEPVSSFEDFIENI
ncbi:DEAD/DEAH box helicase family protein [Methanocorpusculum sp. MG]|uniref:DEAD/DEAH box helicase family protein n=1 Tax=Methanocorpusculum petauri TaxID=3002863 RepID=A0ABT4IEG1_9EURY|nr:DEAD/DEAH box helicase family protein [Methanocorpusculum petauri]MCZ0859744.1 DEAD/DEAH box helicase family protein [Methanocorpusculum petauri]